ncbi:hypothetical protein EVAR_80163_1 [Eumeta japonica]|uniref:Uncharacterized protein n=1 Tax=Eumeta variegata TaxID=151549 RepID=A0A4C1YAC0_EUMVA|nr:hypothetical protein EVAR_80163_1 [Eumeta japonica]
MELECRTWTGIEKRDRESEQTVKLKLKSKAETGSMSAVEESTNSVGAREKELRDCDIFTSKNPTPSAKEYFLF